MKAFFIVAPFLLVLSACGGSGKSNVSSNASATIGKNSVIVVASNAKYIGKKLKITISNMPDSGLFVGAVVDDGSTSIISADVVETSKNTADLKIGFQKGISLGEGNFTSSLKVFLCVDENCNNQITGSPIVVSTELVVKFGSVSVEQTDINVSASILDLEAKPSARIPITIKNEFIDDLYIGIDDPGYYYHTGINDFEFEKVNSESFNVITNYVKPSSFRLGLRRSKIAVNVCYDSTCRNHVSGSPFIINSNYYVSSDPSDAVPVAVVSRTKVSHNVIDAEYSKVLDAIISVSSYPDNALYIYDINTDVESKISLDFKPNAVTVNNTESGQRIAVGHRQKVSVIDYNENNPSLSVLTILDSSSDIVDLVIKGDLIYSVAAEFWVVDSASISEISIPNNTEVFPLPSYVILKGNSRIKLHKSGRYIYFIERNKREITKLEITNGDLSYLYETNLSNDNFVNGDLWLSDDGEAIYTDIGKIYSSSSVNSEGFLPISVLPPVIAKRITSLSDSVLSNEIATIELSKCAGDCYAVLRLFSEDTYDPLATYSFGLVSLDNKSYIEKAKFVFHNYDSSRLFVISSLVNEPTQASFILEVTK